MGRPGGRLRARGSSIAPNGPMPGSDSRWAIAASRSSERRKAGSRSPASGGAPRARGCARASSPRRPRRNSSEASARRARERDHLDPADLHARARATTASASLTRPACAIDTRWESTAQTAASNGVPKQTGRRPPAAASSRPTTGSRSPTSASPLAVDVQRQHPRGVALDPLRRAGRRRSRPRPRPPPRPTSRAARRRPRRRR